MLFVYIFCFVLLCGVHNIIQHKCSIGAKCATKNPKLNKNLWKGSIKLHIITKLDNFLKLQNLQKLSDSKSNKVFCASIYHCNINFVITFLLLFITVSNKPHVLCKNAGEAPKVSKVPCRCQPGKEFMYKTLTCQDCPQGQMSKDGQKCETCPSGHVALLGKHYFWWNRDQLPTGFSSVCVGDCPGGAKVIVMVIVAAVWGELEQKKEKKTFLFLSSLSPQFLQTHQGNFDKSAA